MKATHYAKRGRTGRVLRIPQDSRAALLLLEALAEFKKVALGEASIDGDFFEFRTNAPELTCELITTYINAN